MTKAGDFEQGKAGEGPEDVAYEKEGPNAVGGMMR